MHEMRRLSILLAAGLLASGCVSDETLMNPPPVPATPLLARYVAMGNSITAGMQSAGINDSTQAQAYPALLARMAGDTFYIPALAYPGCPPPYAVPLGPTRVGPSSTSTTCLLREGPQPFISNVAVPGAYASDLSSNVGGGANVLTTLILGGQTQDALMAAEQPTFVSLWAPNNDILAAVNLGDTTAAVLTPLASYMASFNASVNAIKAANPQGAVLIGVVDVPDFAPVVQPGAFFYAASTQSPNPLGKAVDPLTCAPFTPQGQPNPTAFNLVSLQVLADPTIATVTCANDAKWVTTPAERAVFEKRIADINSAVQAAATANNWLFVDPNTDLGDVLADATKFRKCQGIYTATSPATFQAAVLNTCPGPTAPNYFGSFVSFDATHPSLTFHQAFAVLLAQMINTKYGTSISTTPPSAAVLR
jgi:hypothetical protein